VAFQSDRGGDISIWVQAADGSDEAERLTTAEKGESHVPEWWSKDGRLLGYSVLGRDGGELWTRVMGDGKVARFSDIQSNAPLNSAISPDGRWVAYTLRGLANSVPNAVFIQPMPATNARYLVSGDDDAAHHPFWAPDGRDLFFWANRGSALMSASIGTKGSLTVGRPARVSGDHPSNTHALGPLNYDITPDGRHFVFTRRTAAGAADGEGRRESVRVVLNWFEELKRLAPVKP
jgi:Tol biopolymer transport system component